MNYLLFYFKCIDCCAEIQRQLCPGGHVLSLREVWHMLEQIVEGDSEARELEDVGHHGDWGQVLEVPDATQEANGDQGKGHVHPVVNKTKVHQEYLETLL